MELHTCLSRILLLIVFHVNESQAAIVTGPCENASRGQTHHKCELECNSDGSCTESVSEETCGCDGNAFFTSEYTTFMNGQAGISIGKKRRKRQSDDVCSNMSYRCTRCRGGSSRWAEAQSTEFNEGCRGGGGGNRRQGGSSGGGGRSPSCGKKTVTGFTRNGCIYECAGDIQGRGTCATERSGTCGSCFGEDWGGRCSNEPSGCTSCKSVCRNRGK